MTHQMFGIGEVTGLIDPQKIDVLFQDRLRRLIHAQGPDVTVSKHRHESAAAPTSAR